MKIIAWYFLILQGLVLVLSPININKPRKPITEGVAAMSILLNLPLLYLAWKLVFGGVL